MSTTKEQVTAFLDKCGELKTCKFIMATTKIKDLLKCIVNSPELYGLFDAVTKNFNYVEQKARCLVTTDNGVMRKSQVILPQTVGQRLAFIFCLLVEFDRGTLNFNDFLRKYFREDGSYFAGYRAFCENIIVALEDVIKQVFKEQLAEEWNMNGARANSDRVSLLNSISLSIEAEKRFIYESLVPEEEKENAYKILDALSEAVKYGDENTIDALICGYNYFILYFRCVSDGISPLIETLAEYEKSL